MSKILNEYRITYLISGTVFVKSIYADNFILAMREFKKITKSDLKLKIIMISFHRTGRKKCQKLSTH